MNEYSITAEELQEIFDLMADGCRCTTVWNYVLKQENSSL